LPRKLVPLVVFLPDGEQPNSGPLRTEDHPVINFPMIANCSRCEGLQSTLAPTSRSTAALPCEVGKTAASAGLSTPCNIPSTIFTVVITAPVLPALITPSAFPGCTRRAATRMEESRF